MSLVTRAAKNLREALVLLRYYAAQDADSAFVVKKKSAVDSSRPTAVQSRVTLLSGGKNGSRFGCNSNGLRARVAAAPQGIPRS